MNWLWRAGLAGLVGYAALVGGMYVFQRRLMYHGDGEAPDRARAGAEAMAEVRLATADGLDLLAWYAPARPGRRTIVAFHGNAGHIGHRFDKLGPLMDHGHGLLMAEYRGFGGNEGAPTEEGLYADADAALAFAAAQGIDARDIVLYGESLGSGVAVDAASRHPVGGLVLEAPFSSIVDVATEIYWYVPARHLVLDRFESAAKIGRIDAPVLILHGEGDTVVPIRFGRALHAAAREPKTLWVAPGAGHVDLYEHGAGDAVRAFLDRLP